MGSRWRTVTSWPESSYFPSAQAPAEPVRYPSVRSPGGGVFSSPRPRRAPGPQGPTTGTERTKAVTTVTDGKAAGQARPRAPEPPAPSPADLARRPPTGPIEVTGAQSLVRSARVRRGRHHLRHPRRRDPAGVRPAAGLRQGPAHPRPPRAGRRPRGRGLRRRRPARSASAWPPAARAPRTWSRRSPTPTWTRCRWSPSPARSRRPSIGTDAFQEADIRGITMPITKHNYLVTDAGADPARRSPRRSTSPRTGRPGPVLVDISKDALQATTTFDVAAEARPARLPPGRPAAPQADPRGRPADRRGQAAGALRRRRRHPGRRHRRAARASSS